MNKKFLTFLKPNKIFVYSTTSEFVRTYSKQIQKYIFIDLSSKSYFLPDRLNLYYIIQTVPVRIKM